MADYKDIITGTIGNLVDKVKEAASSGTVRSVYEQGAARAKVYGRIAKLGLELNGEHEELKRVYTEIGKLYFDQAKDAPEGCFAPLFAQAKELLSGMEAKEAEIEALKASVESDTETPAGEAPAQDFDIVVDETGRAPDEEE